MIKTIILFIALSINLLAQDLTKKILVGVWQKGSEVVGSGYSECYQFYPNGKFVFNFAESNDTHRIISLQGHYRLINNELYTKIENRTELIGGFIRRGGLGYEDEWVLDSTKTRTVKQMNSDEESYSLKLVKGKVLSFIIGSREDLHYFKLSSDPDFYKD